MGWFSITTLDVLKQHSPPNKLENIFLLTDYSKYRTTRGHEQSLEKYIRDNKFSSMITTYGFGYQLNSNLLNNLSNISNSDGFSYIPDSGLLGNIFIHGISNFLITAEHNVKLEINLNIKFDDGSDNKTIIIDSLKYGQSKNLLFDIDFSISKKMLI